MIKFIFGKKIIANYYTKFLNLNWCKRWLKFYNENEKEKLNLFRIPKNRKKINGILLNSKKQKLEIPIGRSWIKSEMTLIFKGVVSNWFSLNPWFGFRFKKCSAENKLIENFNKARPKSNLLRFFTLRGVFQTLFSKFS